MYYVLSIRHQHTAFYSPYLHSPLNIIHQRHAALFHSNTLPNGFLQTSFNGGVDSGKRPLWRGAEQSYDVMPS